MLDCRKIAVGLMIFCTVMTVMFARAQEPKTFSEGERLALSACLVKCPDGSPACNNRCISAAQTAGRMWAEKVRACVRGCRSTAQASDAVYACVTGCRLDRMVHQLAKAGSAPNMDSTCSRLNHG
jgi:hypothetical protein